MIKGLAHICFVVKDLEASLGFYRDKLGFTRAFDFINDKNERFGVYLHVSGRCFIELFKGEPVAAEKASYKHFCLEVENLAATVTALREKGVVLSDPKLGSDHSWQSWLADPDGNKIELHDYTPQSKQTPWVEKDLVVSSD